MDPDLLAAVSLMAVLGFVVLIIKGAFGGAAVCLVVAILLGAQAASRYRRNSS